MYLRRYLVRRITYQKLYRHPALSLQLRLHSRRSTKPGQLNLYAPNWTFCQVPSQKRPIGKPDLILSEVGFTTLHCKINQEFIPCSTIYIFPRLVALPAR